MLQPIRRKGPRSGKRRPGRPCGGLHFHENVSPDQRKRIIDDLLWLSRQGEEIHTELLADISGIEGRITGPKLLAWLLERTAVISNAPLTPQPVVITPFAVDGRYLAFQAKPYATIRGQTWAVRDREDNGEFAGGVPIVMGVGDASRGEMRSFRFGKALALPLLRGAKVEHQGFLIGRSLWAKFGSDLPEHRVFRLLTYLHEAMHLGSTDGHVKCPKSLPERRLRGRNVCDEGFLTANGLSHAFALAMARHNDLSPKGRVWFVKYAQALKTRIKNHRRAALPRQPIATDAAMAWLRAAAAAPDKGYNVPLRHVVPCEKFAGGCDRRDLEAAVLKMRRWPNEYAQMSR